MSSADAPSEFVQDHGGLLGLACSSCNADLTDDPLFRTHRVCSRCRRHYWIAARDRIALLLDPASFQESNAELASIEPLRFRDRLPVADRLAEEREQPAIADAVVTGAGAIDGNPVVVIALDLAIFGAGVGIVAGEKIALAIEQAVARRWPVIAICSAGSGRGREGVLAMAQIGKLAASAARLRRAGLPLIALLTHPTSGNVVVGLANQADLCFAEPGAHVGVGGGASLASQRATATAEELIELGALDRVLDRTEQRRHLGRLLALLADRNASQSAPHRATMDAGALIEAIATDLIPLHGDRSGADHAGVAGGIGRVGDATAILLGLEQSATKLDRAVFAKVNRLLRLAAHLELPVVALVDHPSRGEQIGPATALQLAQSLALLAAIPVPIVTVVTGEASGLAAMTLLTADRVLMRDGAAITLPSGEQVATARDCLRLGLVDAVLPAAQADHEATALVAGIAAALSSLAGIGTRRLVDDRNRRLRQIGLGTVESRAAAHVEWRELQEVQQAIGRSLGELRRRWELRQLALPSLANRPSLPFTFRPSFPAMTMPKLTIRRPDFGEMAERVAAVRKGQPGRGPHERGDGGDGSDGE